MKTVEKKVHSGTEQKWAYRLKNGTFYKQCERGSWSTSMKEPTKKELTTGDLSKATFFNQSSDSPPYLTSFMLGGKWIDVTITKTYSWG